MELIAVNAEVVPAVAAEVDITSKAGTKRKRSCRSATEKPKKSRKKSKSNKENNDVLPEAESESLKKRSKSTRCLKKAEKQAVATAINKVDKTELVACVLEHVDKELHIRSFQDRSIFWDKLKVSNMLVTICECLRELYESTYIKYSAGKEKHARFQLEWYQQCGYLLLDDVAGNGDTRALDSSISGLIPKWMAFRKNQLNVCPAYHANAVLIAVQGAVFNYLAHTAAEHMPSVEQDETQSASTCTSISEPDDVHYRFGGAAIAEMLKKRYRSIHRCPQNNRGMIVVEISILKAMECPDKSIIPASLQYRDKGFMYFPDQALIPFIKAVDDKVKEVANKKGVQEHGENIVQVTTDKVRADTSFRTTFENFLLRKFDSLDDISNSKFSFY